MKFKVLFSTNKGSLNYDSFFENLKNLGMSINNDVIEFDDVELVDKISEIVNKCGVKVILNRIE